MELKKLKQDKRGAGIASTVIAGVASLVILVVVMFIILDNIATQDILSSTTCDDISLNVTCTSYNITERMIGNYSEGIGNISEKVPTILLIAAVVILFGAIVLLVIRSRQMQVGGGSL